MASFSSSAATAGTPASTFNQQRPTANLIGGRLVTTLPLLPSKVYPPPPCSARVPYRKAFNNSNDKSGDKHHQSPLVLQISPATSPKVNKNNRRRTPPNSPKSLPNLSPPVNFRSFDDYHGDRRRRGRRWSSGSDKSPAAPPDAQRIDLWGTSECDSGHQGLIHDIQINFDGSKLATASEDKTVKVFDVDPKTDVTRCVVTLRGHQGPVWKLSWADPSMGNILASASADGTVKVWREGKSMFDLNYGEECWYLWKEFVEESKSPDATSTAPIAAFSVCWAPWTFGLTLACGYSNGYICVHSYEDDQWKSNKFKAHTVSVKAVSWAPAISPSMEYLFLKDTNCSDVFRFASCGEADLCVKIWRNEGESWAEEERLNGLMSYVKDVTWSPNANTMRIAACGADMRVIIWSFGNEWEMTFSTLLYEDPWTISWNSLGDQLVVSQTDSQVFISKRYSNPEDDTDSWTLQLINGGS